MTVIKSAINPRAAEFQANAAAMSKTVADLRDKAAQVSLGGGESARAKHSARGKLLPRDRVDHLQKIAASKKPTQLILGGQVLGLFRLDPPGLTVIEFATDGSPSVVDVSLTLKAATDAQINVGLIRPIRGRLKGAARKRR